MNLYCFLKFKMRKETFFHFGFKILFKYNKKLAIKLLINYMLKLIEK